MKKLLSPIAFEIPSLSLSVRSGGRSTQSFALVIEQALHFCPGEFVCVMGLNGSGKSTFLRLLSGLSHASFSTKNKPDIMLWQQVLPVYSLLDLARLRACLQQFEQVSGMSVETCIRLSESPFGSDVAGLSIHDLLESFDLQALKNTPIDELSGGQRQRVHLARVFWQCELMFAVSPHPPILMMDEPMNHLDFNGQKQLIAQMLKLKQRGALIIVSSHLLDIAHVASRCVLFRHGRLVQDICWTNQDFASRQALIEHLFDDKNISATNG